MRTSVEAQRVARRFVKQNATPPRNGAPTRGQVHYTNGSLVTAQDVERVVEDAGRPVVPGSAMLRPTLASEGNRPPRAGMAFWGYSTECSYSDFAEATECQSIQQRTGIFLGI